MPYTPDPTDTTQPTTGQKATTAAAEFTALKTYLQGTVLPLIAAKLPLAGGTLSGMLSSTSGEAFRIEHNSGFLSGWNGANSLRTGYLQFITGTSVNLVAEGAAVLGLGAGLKQVVYTGDNFYPAASTDLGQSANRWSKLWAVNASLTGDVTAATFHGDGSGLTNLPGGGSLTSGQVTTALGYTPYNATNPAGYIAGINSGMVTAALGYTPYNSSNPSGYISSINKSMVDTAIGVVTGSNAKGTRTVSSSAPSGGVDGDIWLQV